MIGRLEHLAEYVKQFSDERLRQVWDGKTSAAHRDANDEDAISVLRGEFRRRKLLVPDEAPRLPPYIPTPIENAFQAIWSVGQRIGMIPHRRDPAEPVNEALIAERWAKVPAEERQRAREAFVLLNIPMQDGLA